MRACNFRCMRWRRGRRYGKRADRLIFHNLENNTAVSTTRSNGELEAAKLRVQKRQAEIAGESFPAKPKYHCAFCPYRNLCPATEKVVGGKIVGGKIGAAPQKKSASRVN